MADEDKSPEPPDQTPVATPPSVEELRRKTTDNPGEGEYMFSDWALI